ncbi:MAG: hypothetical protein LBM70_03075, partial [Victivallales bacterium]|nr:hypothetical protein [Victivallales bacterium]
MNNSAFSTDMLSSLTLYYAKCEQIFRNPGTHCRANDVIVTCENNSDSLRIAVTGDYTPIRFLKLRWNFRLPDTALFLGDAWERSYGDLQFRSMDSGRFMPWYFFMRQEDAFHGFGVKTGGGAFALWSADPAGVTLYLDLRCGTEGVILNGRIIEAATIIFQTFPTDSFTEACRAFCTKMCDRPLQVTTPVYGGNNWYYAYGNSSRREILDDCRRLAAFCENLKNPPFMVIDDGWQPGERSMDFNGGPWDRGNDRFPNMETLPKEMLSLGVRPGIWLRPLQNAAPEIPGEWQLRRWILDPTIPDVREWIFADIQRISRWGFQLLKHDFTTYDLFGKWGFEANPWLASGDWSFADRSRTSAEVVTDLYRLILEAAGSAMI